MKNTLFRTSALVLTASVLASCGGGGSSTPTPTPPPPPPVVVDTTAPVVTFSPTTLTVASGATGTATLTATDNVGVTSGPTVTCTNGGTFSGSTFTAPTVTTATTSVCTATASDAAGNTGSAALNVTIPEPAPAPTSVSVTGKITFDFVPHNTTTSGLNYAAITQKPVRGATVEALNAAGTVLQTAQTNAAGDYSFTLTPNTDVRIRVKAELLQTTGARWDVKVTDNTQSNALYSVQGSLVNTGVSNAIRDLNAASGWGGSSYTTPRAAAPFAILDPIYEAVTAFAAVDTDINFPAVELRWSTRNRSESGDLTTGQIGTSSYRGNGTSGNIFILGDANNDTDEYDRHVVVHEWGHYFEDRMARSDSVGGPHSGGDRLDPRVAMGEGWGNALSGMILGDPFYRDSLGAAQSQGFSINVENNNGSNRGWFNEASVQSILYDIFDSADDGSDSISLGLAPIYNVFSSDSYKDQTFFTTIFGFLDELKTQAPASAAAIDSLTSAQSISGTGPEGTGETNTGTVARSLPLYKALTVGGAAVEICSIDDQGTFNKLGNREYLRVNIPTAGSYTFTMTKTTGAANRDPDFNIFRGSTIAARAESSAADSETLTTNLQAGVHVIDAYEFNNISPGTQGDSCFNFSVTG